MDEVNFEDQFRDAELLNSVSPSDDIGSSETDEQLWRMRVSEYKAHALAADDPEEAVLARHNAALIELVGCFETAIRDELTAGGVSVNAFAQLKATLDDYYKLSRQINRHACFLERRVQDRRREEQARRKSTGFEFPGLMPASRRPPR